MKSVDAAQGAIRNPQRSFDGRSRAFIEALLLAGFCGFLFFYGLNRFGLIGRDEPRYAQVAREMLARKDWITPVLGGKPWLEKPVLYYWEAMLSYSLFGVDDWAARIPSGLNATLVVIVVYLFLKRFRPGLPLDGALMAASAAGLIGYARGASTDMPLAAMFALGLLAWYAWQESGRRFYLAGFYVLMALGLLAKGPVAPFLAAVIIALYAATTGELRLIRRMLWLPGILLFCAVGLPWYIAVQLHNPQFFRVFILEHNLERFATDLYHHQHPFWYFLPVSLLALLPWTIFVVQAVIDTLRGWRRAESSRLSAADPLNKFLVIWLLVPIVFFSFSQSKLPGYILPALPAGTLLVAEYVRRHAERGDRPTLPTVALHSILACLPILPSLMIARILVEGRLSWSLATLLSFTVTALVAAAMMATLARANSFPMLRFVTLIPVVLALAAVLKTGGSRLDDALSARPLAADIDRVERGMLPAAIFHLPSETEYGLMFYRNQMIPSYDRGEVPPGAHLLIAPQGFQRQITAWNKGRRVSLIGTFDAQHLEYFWVSAISQQGSQ